MDKQTDKKGVGHTVGKMYFLYLTHRLKTGSTWTDEHTDKYMGRCCHLPRCKGIPEFATSEGCSSDIGDTEDKDNY